jgi:hypothetical protein
MRLRTKVSRCTLADGTENRDWRIFDNFAEVLIKMASDLFAHDELAVALDETLYALDASPIDLCLSLFCLARFRKAKGAAKRTNSVSTILVTIK